MSTANLSPESITPSIITSKREKRTKRAVGVVTYSIKADRVFENQFPKRSRVILLSISTSGFFLSKWEASWMNEVDLPQKLYSRRKGLHFLHHLLVWPFWSLFSLFTGKLGNWQKRKKRQSTCCSTAIMMSGKLWLILGCCSPEIGVKVYYTGSAAAGL